MLPDPMSSEHAAIPRGGSSLRHCLHCSCCDPLSGPGLAESRSDTPIRVISTISDVRRKTIPLPTTQLPSETVFCFDGSNHGIIALRDLPWDSDNSGGDGTFLRYPR